MQMAGAYNQIERWFAEITHVISSDRSGYVGFPEKCTVWPALEIHSTVAPFHDRNTLGRSPWRYLPDES
jgi:hypothetical protein